MISVLSAVAEIERENILVQTMEGCKQKAREGKWNSGCAPYGYQLINGELHIAEDEAEIIRIIYDKFANTTMGIAAIATFLNNSGYKKKLRQNNTIEGVSTSFVKGVLDNPVYCGKFAFGRKALYMILLDRRCLSECNGDAWRDEYGAIFIIFTIKEMMKLLHLGNKKINKMLKELESHNLIYRSHQGLGKPNKIYVYDLLKADNDNWLPKQFKHRKRAAK